MKRVVVLLCLAVLLAGSLEGYAHAQEDKVEPGIIIFTGRVKHFSHSGGFYGITTLDGKEYRPVRLDSSFQVEGLRVWVEARPVTKKLLASGWGVPIEIIKIKRYSP